MNRMPAAFAPALLLAASFVGAPARAQQPGASRPATAAPPAHAPQAPSAPGSRAQSGTRAVRGPPVYRVELVMFRATSALGAAEDWGVEAGTAAVTSTDADPGASSEAAHPDAGGGAPGGAAPSGADQNGAAPSAPQASATLPAGVVRLLPASEYALDGVAERLRASGRYVPVAHAAWVQTASPWGKPVEIPLQGVGLDAQGLTGNLALERGVYLHLALDLRYAMSDPPDGLDAPPGTVFVLDESHRVRLKEGNYFDHPAFGVIALVTPGEASGGRGGPAAPPRQP